MELIKIELMKIFILILNLFSVYSDKETQKIHSNFKAFNLL